VPLIASSSNDMKINVAKDNLSVSPNPVTNHSTITFSAAAAGKVSLGIYDMNGRLMTTIFNGVVEKGLQRQVSFDAVQFNSGMYVCRLQTPTGTISQKIIVRR
jgi:hypothetical protein